MSDTVLGAIIGVTAALLGAVVTHVLSLREDKIKRERDEEQQKKKDVRDALGALDSRQVNSALMAMRIKGGEAVFDQHYQIVGTQTNAAGEPVDVEVAQPGEPEKGPEEPKQPDE